MGASLEALGRARRAVRQDRPEGTGRLRREERAYVDNACFYTDELVEQTLAVLGELQERGLPGRFVLAGLCSGAYWTFHAAVRDERVLAALMIDLYAFEWSGEPLAQREPRRTLALARGGGLRWLRPGVVTPGRVWRLSRGTPLYDDLVRAGCLDQLERWPNLALESIPSRDHTFRAIWLQQQVHASLDRVLGRVLHSLDAPRLPAPSLRVLGGQDNRLLT